MFAVGVNAAVIAPGSFAGDAEFRLVFEGRGHRRDAEFQFLARTGNREDRLGPRFMSIKQVLIPAARIKG